MNDELVEEGAGEEGRVILTIIITTPTMIVSPLVAQYHATKYLEMSTQHSIVLSNPHPPPP